MGVAEDMTTFFVGIEFAGRMMECRMVDKVVVVMMVVGKMVWYFGMVDFG